MNIMETLNTTDTPRTDAARTLGGVIVNDSLALLGEPRSFDSINVVPADFARDLERELHDAEIRIQAEVSRTEMLNCELAESKAEVKIFRKEIIFREAMDNVAQEVWDEMKAEVERLSKLTEDCLSVIRVHCPTYYNDAMERFNKTNK